MAGFLQLAGGTNAHTVDGLRKVGLFQTASFPNTTGSPNSLHPMISGVAYGGYARKVGLILSKANHLPSEQIKSIFHDLLKSFAT